MTLSRVLATTLVAALLATSGCAKSGSPEVEELVKTLPPSFSGAANRNFTTPSQIFLLQGDCDPVSYGLEYSFDQVTWTEIVGGCPSSGSFVVRLTILVSRDVYIRAKTKFGYTSSALASIRFLLPPTSPLLTFASASSSDMSDHNGSGAQSVLGHVFTGIPLTSANRNVETYVPGVVYAE